VEAVGKKRGAGEGGAMEQQMREEQGRGTYLGAGRKQTIGEEAGRRRDCRRQEQLRRRSRERRTAGAARPHATSSCARDFYPHAFFSHAHAHFCFGRKSARARLCVASAASAPRRRCARLEVCLPP
jgi:hypothetical protein